MTESDDPWIGQTLLSYTILRRIGEGGMGIIYLARHNSLGRMAAVKFLPGTMASDKSYVELFLREAQSAAKLRHPNIVDVYDAGQLGEGLYYFIMEYVEGENLSTMLQARGKLPVREAVEYARQAASALAYAHQKNIIHRDIKPENLLLTQDRLIRVVDLGLAKWTGEESSMLTQTGDILGSPVYIAPERLSDPQASHAGTDVYSLGCTLFHLVSGRTPYEGTMPVIMAKHLTEPVPDPRKTNPDIDVILARIIMKMMAKDPADRYQTMEEVESALSGYLAGKPVHGREAASGKSRWLILGVVLLAAGAAAFFLVPRIVKPEKPVDSPATAAAVDQPDQPGANTAKPAAAGAPFLIADFNTETRVNRVNGTFGARGSVQPQPVGWCSERLLSFGGVDNTGCWQIEYNISAPGSTASAWMRLEGFDASGYDTLRIRFHTENDAPLNFLLELKAGDGKSKVARRQTVRVPGKTWITFDFPLTRFDASAVKSLSEIAILFDGQVTGLGKGSLEVDGIEFLKAE